MKSKRTTTIPGSSVADSGLRAVVVAGGAAPAPSPAADATWNSVVVAPEARCSPYDSGDYQYRPSVEELIIRGGAPRTRER